MKSPMDSTKFLCETLSKLLNTEITSDISDYIMSMESESSLEEYLRDIITEAPESHVENFIEQAKKCWRQQRGGTANNKTHTKKGKNFKSFNVDYGGSGFKLEEKVAQNEPKNHKASFKQNTPSSDKNIHVDTENINNSNKKNQKVKFKPLFGKEGQAKIAAKLPGRHRCECQTQKHPLVNNCLSCGRVVCQQEGSGPCFFCGELVCTKEEQEILLRNSNKSNKLRSYLMAKEFEKGAQINNDNNDDDDDNNDDVSDKKNDDKLMKALNHKNKLLDFDKHSVSRTKVIDDDCDYFTSSKWMSNAEKDGLKRKEEERRSEMHASRRGARKFDLDFIGGSIKESEKKVASFAQLAEDDDIYAANFIPAKNMSHIAKNPKEETVEGRNIEERLEDFLKSVKRNIANNDEDLFQPTYVPEDEANKDISKNHHHQQQPHQPPKEPAHKSVIKDSVSQMMVDKGCCLSMHQPWASLLVAGVKRHEGRSWYSDYRGLLWIASTSKPPEHADILNIQATYNFNYPDHQPFPKSYPTSCLLGRVLITDCLAQDEYRETYPEGESECDFVFICSDPAELPLKLPIRGKPKIYQLDSNLHKGAKKILEDNYAS